MQKILYATDGLSFEKESVRFACYIAQATNSVLTGIILENLVENQKFILKPAYGTIYADWEINQTSPAVVEKLNSINSNIAKFREFCEKQAVRTDLHLEPGVPLNELIAQTRFADLLVVSANTSFDKADKQAPTNFIRNVLKDAECPVVVAPESFEGIEEIVFAYDGSRSSAFAMRQFTYLFPQMKNRPVTVFQVNKKGVFEEAEKKNINDWLKNYYYPVNFECLAGEPDEKILTYLYHKKRVMVVMGAFGRSAMSMFFKPSKAESILQLITQPLFISHF